MGILTQPAGIYNVPSFPAPIARRPWVGLRFRPGAFAREYDSIPLARLSAKDDQNSSRILGIVEQDPEKEWSSWHTFILVIFECRLPN